MKNSQDTRAVTKSARAAAISNLFFCDLVKGLLIFYDERAAGKIRVLSLGFIRDSKAKARRRRRNKTSREMGIRAEDEPQQFIISPPCTRLLSVCVILQFCLHAQ
jgi:hypothetical protein